jgi:hypothetical protein
VLRLVAGHNQRRRRDALALVHKHVRALAIHVVRNNNTCGLTHAVHLREHGTKDKGTRAGGTSPEHMCKSSNNCAVFEPGESHMSNTMWCGCTASRNGGSIDTASCRLMLPTAVRSCRYVCNSFNSGLEHESATQGRQQKAEQRQRPQQRSHHHTHSTKMLASEGELPAVTVRVPW